MRNFLWSGDPSVRKGTTVALEKVCKPQTEAGLGIRRLCEVNSALLMKLAWKSFYGKDDFSKWMQHKFIDKHGDFIEYHKASSLWPGIRCVLNHVTDNSQWSIGSGVNVDFWRHNWLDYKSIKLALELINSDYKGMQDKVGDLRNGDVIDMTPPLLTFINAAHLPHDKVINDDPGEEDRLLWCPDIRGIFSSAFETIRRKKHKVAWHWFIWSTHIHPRTSAIAWKIVKSCTATDDIIGRKGIVMVSICPMCKNDEESLPHLLLECEVAQLH